jgi:HD-GYP domain-containing protein (c-di-GMP phosphodiesterase class II)
VTAIAEAIARRLGWDEDRLALLRVGGPLHDIGKLGVSDDILCKEGRLELRELAQIRRHPTIGAKILLRVNAFREALPYVLYHHERWDGSGYPTGKAGEEIPVEARVLAVADAYEAMTADRPYRASIGPDAAEAELRRGAGTQFDSDVVDALLEAVADGDDALPSPV